jgi:rhamnosyltransferase subunit B
VPTGLPPSVFHCGYAPFGLLLPRASALVHHGGIGTTAQGLRAGLPQVLTPLGFDQFDNAMRLESLSVGTSVPHQDTQFDSMTPRLRDLLGSARVADACRAAAANLQVNTALDTVCDTLESAQ